MEQGLDAIERNTRLQAQLVDDLLDLSRIITGKIELVCVPNDFNEIVRHALEEPVTSESGNGCRASRRQPGGEQRFSPQLPE